MKQINNYITEKLVLNKNSKNKSYHPKTKDELKELVDKLIKERGNDADLNNIDTSKITDMSFLFKDSKFNGDISEWNVSNVTNMQAMFANSEFNGDLSKWDVSNVTNMHCMFNDSKFTGENGDISNWDVKKVNRIEFMFADTKFTGDINNWEINLNNIQYWTDKYGVFNNSPLENNPPKWYKI